MPTFVYLFSTKQSVVILSSLTSISDKCYAGHIFFLTLGAGRCGGSLDRFLLVYSLLV